MRTLIVGRDSQEVLQELGAQAAGGEFEAAENGDRAVERFVRAVEESRPYGLLILDLDTPGLEGDEVLAKIMEWAREPFLPADAEPLRVVFLAKYRDDAVVACALCQAGYPYLPKPADAGKLAQALDGQSRCQPADLAAIDRPALVARFLAASSPLGDAEFRRRLGKRLALDEAAFLAALGECLFSGDLNIKTKMSVIRAMAGSANPATLPVLKRIIDEGTNFFLVKEAMLGLARLGSRRALCLLRDRAGSVKDATLKEQIAEAMGRIPPDDPVFSLTARLAEETGKAALQEIVEALKRILPAKDAEIFLDYLESPNHALVVAAFEILAHCGGIDMSRVLVEFHAGRMAAHLAGTGLSAEEMTQLTTRLRSYYEHFPGFARGRLPGLEEAFPKVSDPALRKEVLAILAMSEDPQVMASIREIYTANPELRGTILNAWVENESCADFILDRFLDDEGLREKIAQHFSRTRHGRDILASRFFTMPESLRETLARTMDFSIEEGTEKLLLQVLDSEKPKIRQTVLSRLDSVPEGPLLDLLSDPTREEDFLALGEGFLAAAKKSFPFVMAKRLLLRLGKTEAARPALAAWLGFTAEVAQREVVVALPGAKAFECLARSVLDNGDMNAFMVFLELLRRVNTFCPVTYSDMQRALGLYTQTRGTAMGEKESMALRQARDNLQRNQKELDTATRFEEEMAALLAKQVISPDHIEQAINGNRLGASLRFNRVIAMLAAQMKAHGDRETRIWNLVTHYPVMLKRLKEYRAAEAREAGGEGAEGEAQAEAGARLSDSLPLIVLNIADKALSALVRDQIREVLPGIRMACDVPQPGPADILFCDPAFLGRYAGAARPASRKIFLLLKDPNDFGKFQHFNPKALLFPLSLHKMLKLLLPDVYFA